MMLPPEAGLQLLLYHQRQSDPATPGLRPIVIMPSALLGQDVGLNSFVIALAMLPPQSLLDTSMVEGGNIEAWKLGLNPKSLPRKEVREDRAAVYDKRLLVSNLSGRIEPALTMLAQIQISASAVYIVPTEDLTADRSDLTKRSFIFAYRCGPSALW